MNAITKHKGIAGKLKARRAKALAAVSKLDRVALFDGSISMNADDAVGLNGIPASRWQALEQVWSKLAPMCKGRLGAYVFSDSPVPVRGSAAGNTRLPYKGGGTAMCRALDAASVHHHPRLRVLLVSDGESTDGDPVPHARALHVPVDTIFVGPKGSKGASTLEAIARATGGQFREMNGFDAARFLKHCVDVLRLKG